MTLRGLVLLEGGDLRFLQTVLVAVGGFRVGFTLAHGRWV